MKSTHLKNFIIIIYYTYDFIFVYDIDYILLQDKSDTSV